MKNGLFIIMLNRKDLRGKRNESPLVIPKAGLHPKKVMLCVWWDWKGILYYELLSNNQTINSEKYCSQLDKLKTAIDQKRPELANWKGVVFYQDNARPHVCVEYFDYSTKVAGAWLESAIPPIVFTRPCTLRFSPL